MLKKTGKFGLSVASMDSLAIIAYKQPISRYEIEAIRGVDSSGVLKTLLNKSLIKIKGRDSARVGLYYTEQQMYLWNILVLIVYPLPKQKFQS